MYIKADLPTCDKPHPLPLTATSELTDKPHPLHTSEQGTDDKSHLLPISEKDIEKPHPLPINEQGIGDKPRPLLTSEQGTGNKPHPPLESSGVQLVSTEQNPLNTQHKK